MGPLDMTKSLVDLAAEGRRQLSTAAADQDLSARAVAQLQVIDLAVSSIGQRAQMLHAETKSLDPTHVSAEKVERLRAQISAYLYVDDASNLVLSGLAELRQTRGQMVLEKTRPKNLFAAGRSVEFAQALHGLDVLIDHLDDFHETQLQCISGGTGLGTQTLARIDLLLSQLQGGSPVRASDFHDAVSEYQHSAEYRGWRDLLAEIAHVKGAIQLATRAR